MPIDTSSRNFAAFSSIFLGCTYWLVCSIVAGKSEPWDSDNFYLYYFIAVLMCGGLGYVFPAAWLAVSFLFIASDMLVQIVRYGLSQYVLIGIFFNSVLSVPAILVAWLGASIHDRLKR